MDIDKLRMNGTCDDGETTNKQDTSPIRAHIILNVYPPSVQRPVEAVPEPTHENANDSPVPINEDMANTSTNTNTDISKIPLPPPEGEEVLPSTFIVKYPLLRMRDDLQEINNNRPARKTIWIFFDGTWNEERSEDSAFAATNVLRMYNEVNKGEHHRVHYFRGVGNTQDNSLARRLEYGITGKDAVRIKDDAYSVVRSEYVEGDTLIIMGFSRGAACARLLAHDLCSEVFKQVRCTYKVVPNNLTKQMELRTVKVDRCGGKDEKINVAFLGCWDTVGALFCPERAPSNRFLDSIYSGLGSLCSWAWKCIGGYKGWIKVTEEIPENVIKAVHCVAMDETRNEFLPTLMKAEASAYKRNQVEEVWFAGSHSDVGGGYKDNALSDISYQFMKGKIEDAIMGNSEEAIYRGNLWKESSKCDGDGVPRSVAGFSEPGGNYVFHLHGWTFVNQRYVRAMRTASPDKNSKVQVHVSVRELINGTRSQATFAENEKGTKRWEINYLPVNLLAREQISKSKNGSSVEFVGETA